jgi:hypothetical protein
VIDMRVLLTLAFAPIAALAACNPYNPDLGQTPFRCGASEPMCPSGYACVAGLCEEDNGDGPDADVGNPDGGCQDPAEQNDMITTATNGAVFDQLPMIMFEGLSLCPMMDVDYFHLNQPNNCGGAGPACPNLDVLAEFEDLGVPPTVVIQNATGVTVAMGGTTGTAGEIKAVLNNVAQGQYYVRVTAQAVLDHYALTIDGTRTQ